MKLINRKTIKSLLNGFFFFLSIDSSRFGVFIVNSGDHFLLARVKYYYHRQLKKIEFSVKTNVQTNPQSKLKVTYNRARYKGGGVWLGSKKPGFNHGALVF